MISEKLKTQTLSAIEQVHASGSKVTMQAVRNVLGGGSFSSISPILASWKADKQNSSFVSVDMPNDVELIINKSGRDLWNKLNLLTSEKVALIQSEADKAISLANFERDEFFDEIQNLEKTVESSNSLNEQYVAKFNEFEKDLAKLVAVSELQQFRLDELLLEKNNALNAEKSALERATIAEFKLNEKPKSKK